MLRASVLSSRQLAGRSGILRAQSQSLLLRSAASRIGKRSFADDKKPDQHIKDSIKSSEPAIVPQPGSVTPTGTSSAPTTVTTAPLVPPVPASKTAPSIPPPPPPPPPPAPKKRRSFFRFLVYFSLFTGAAYVGGVFYALKSDNFHDFFTEYVPFGEEAVLYLEERQFRKRFPSVSSSFRSVHHVKDPGEKVTIPTKSGVTWKVKEDKDEPSKLTSAVKPAEVNQSHKADKDKEAPTSSATGFGKNAPASEAAPSQKSASSSTPASAPAPEISKPTVKPIDPLNIENADEPVVLDIVKVLNNIIAAVNSDGSTSQNFTTIVSTAKNDILSLSGKIKTLAKAEKDAAAEQIKNNHEEFDRAAKELLRRLEGEMQEMESRWRDEFESERERIAADYEKKLKAQLEQAQKVAEQTKKNELLEQAIQLKKQFAEDIKTQVETEREARLGKLQDLSQAVENLEKVTADSSQVFSENLKTQHLHIALSALQSAIASNNQPRAFVEELEAIKEVVPDSAVVSAAISSINPSAYQRGLPSDAQLLDRFRRVSAEVRKAALLPSDAGVASHALSVVLSKLLFKRQGLVDGDDVESILTRTETLLEEGNLDAATREMNSLSGWARTLSRDWVSEARKVLEVRQAVEVIAAEARLQSLRVE